MASVDLGELRQHASDVVRRAEAGEEIVVTVAGRPSVRLVRASGRTWHRYDEIADVFAGGPDPDRQRDDELIDPDALRADRE